MGLIAVLPQALADQIAAGEVVERPASVVKELVENALDAGATRIFVDVEDGGKRLVRVVDDGHGMGREDALLCVRRHATSKIRDAADLCAIGTLGFRGEALPSIASVSQFTLVTRTAELDGATEVRIEGGAEPTVRDAGGPVGTRVEVRHLFHNVPARLKFLKRTATEMGHIRGLLSAAALGYPHVHFRLAHNSRTSLDHPPAATLRQRIFQILGRKVTEGLYEVRLDAPIRIRGYLSEPGKDRTNQQGIHTFVNGRHVRDRVVNHAIVAAYGTLLDRGRYPHAVLYVHLDPADLDVNVHPTKSEVRFVHRGRVHEAIVHACRQTLVETPWVPTANPLYGRDERQASPGAPWLVREPRARAAFLAPASGSQALALDPPLGTGEGGGLGHFGRMRILGQADKTYLVCADENGLHIIDRHAAHERVGFERIRSGYCNARLARQPMLLPISLELSTQEAAAVADHLEVLHRLGFELEPFGGNTWLLVTVPALLAQAAVEPLVRDVIANLTDLGQATIAEARLDLLFSTMACHSVVRAGDVLGEEEIRALLCAMDEVDLGANCPHGRPVLVTIPFSDLERKLHRT